MNVGIAVVASELEEAVETRTRRIRRGDVDGIVAFAHVEGGAVHVDRANGQRNQEVRVGIAVAVSVGRKVVGIKEVADLEILRDRLAVVARNSGREVLRRLDAS